MNKQAMKPTKTPIMIHEAQNIGGIKTYLTLVVKAKKA
jgi:hypothetical protein